jgi:cytochrome c-type biogenesis protein CcmH
VIGARVSKSGDPMPASGDLQGVSGVIEVRALAEPIQVDIDQRLP